MENYTLVRQEHLNHYGYLFGGITLKWVDELSWITATRDYPECTFVTRAMDNIEFKTSVENGSIMRFDIRPYNKGNTSITYVVEVFAIAPGQVDEKKVFTTHITFVNIDKNGKKGLLPVKEKLLSELN